MPKTETPTINPIDPLFNKPHDNISGITNGNRRPVSDILSHSDYQVDNLRRLTANPDKEPLISRESLKRALAATALGATLLLANHVNGMIDSADKKASISFEDDALSNSEKTVMKGSVVFNSGVEVRRYPSVVDADEYSEGNLAFTVAEGQQLELRDPVSVQVAPEETWFAFTMNKGGPEGKDPVTLWVKNSVLSQTGTDGTPMAQLGVEGLYESGLAENIAVDSLGFMSVEGAPVSVGMMNG